MRPKDSPLRRVSNASSTFPCENVWPMTCRDAALGYQRHRAGRFLLDGGARAEGLGAARRQPIVKGRVRGQEHPPPPAGRRTPPAPKRAFLSFLLACEFTGRQYTVSVSPACQGYQYPQARLRQRQAEAGMSLHRRAFMMVIMSCRSYCFGNRRFTLASIPRRDIIHTQCGRKPRPKTPHKPNHTGGGTTWKRATPLSTPAPSTSP